MGQKVNPISLRLQQTNREFDNCWYSNYFYRKLLSRDIYLQYYINSFLKLVKSPTARFSIQYSPKNIKLFTFLCYPKQSRLMRSKMFGLSFRKKQKKNGKKKLQLFSLKKKNLNKKKQQKIVNFLLDHNFWYKVPYPFIKKSNNLDILKKRLDIDKKKSENIIIDNLYNTLFFNIYNNKYISNISGYYLLPLISKQILKNSKSQTIRLPFLEFQDKLNNFRFDFNFFSKEKKLKSISSSEKNRGFYYTIKRNKKQNKDLTFFIKNYLITIFFKKLLNNVSTKKEKYNKFHNIFSFTSNYKKNFLKNFLTFYLLYSKYNKYTFTQLQKQSNREILLNQIHFISNFQPMFLFQSRNPFFFLKEQKSTSIEKLNAKHYLINQLLLDTKENILFQQIDDKDKYYYKYKNYIQKFLSSQFNINTEFVPFVVSHDWQNAGFLADEIVYFLERRVTFRQLKNKIIKKIAENSAIRGIRITCSGRVGGKSKKAQRAKTECIKYGQTSRHTFSSPIDFAVRTARTRFGSVGIKVWICYNQ